MFSISENEILLGDRSLMILNTKTNKHSEPYNDLLEEKLGIPFDSIKVSAITRDENGSLFIGTWSDHGLIILNPNDQSVSQHFPLPVDSASGKIPRTMIGEIAIDRAGKLWMPVFNVGLANFNVASKTFEVHRPDPKNTASLSDPQIESIMMDNSGAIWLGAARSLMKHDSEKKKFSLISTSEKADIQSSFNEKWGLFIDSNDDLWTGSIYRGSGIDVIDMETKSVTNHIPPNANEQRGISMWSVAEDADGRIWGRTQYDIFVSEKNKMNFESVWDRSNVSIKETGPIRTFMLGIDKRFWIFSEKKTWWVEFKQDSIIWVDASSRKGNLKDLYNIGGRGYRNKGNLNNDSYLFIKEGSTRIGRSTQLLSVSYENFKIDTIYDHTTADKKIPGFGALTHINQSKDGMYWLTTYGEGFTRFDITTGDFNHYGINDGYLIHISIVSMKTDLDICGCPPIME
jgi:ligand-binding sensor domain-containing protein